MGDPPISDSDLRGRGGDDPPHLVPIGKKGNGNYTGRRTDKTPSGHAVSLPVISDTPEDTITIPSSRISANRIKSRGVEYGSCSPTPLGMDEGVSEGGGTGSANPGRVGSGGSHHGWEEDPVVGAGSMQTSTPYTGANLYHAGGSTPNTTSGAPQEGDYSGGDVGYIESLCVCQLYNGAKMRDLPNIWTTIAPLPKEKERAAVDKMCK